MQELIIVMNNNFKFVQMINNELLPIQLALEAAAEVAEIKELIQLAQFKITVKWIWSCQTIRTTFEEDPSQHMIAIADTRAKQVRIRNSDKENITNIKWYGKYVLIYNDQLISRSITETYRLIDALEIKQECIKHKFPNLSELIDLNARACFKLGVSTGMIKYYYRVN